MGLPTSEREFTCRLQDQHTHRSSELKPFGWLETTVYLCQPLPETWAYEDFVTKKEFTYTSNGVFYAILSGLAAGLAIGSFILTTDVIDNAVAQFKMKRP